MAKTKKKKTSNPITEALQFLLSEHADRTLNHDPVSADEAKRLNEQLDSDDEDSGGTD